MLSGVSISRDSTRVAEVNRDVTSRDWRALLHRAGLRVTRQRLTTLRVLEQHPHNDAASVVKAAGDTSMTLQAVHEILQQLTLAGIVRRVDLPDSRSARYETRVGDNHHHIQCVVCGRVEDVNCVVGSAPCLHPSDTHGMVVLQADIVFRGVCPSCAAKARREGTTIRVGDNAYGNALPPGDTKSEMLGDHASSSKEDS